MNLFHSYLLETSISLGILTIGFLFLLRKTTYFQLNRGLILGLIALSLLLPAIPKISVSYSSIPEVEKTVNYIDESFDIQFNEIAVSEPIIYYKESLKTENTPKVAEEEKTAINIVMIFTFIYWMGVVVMFITFCIQLFSTLQLTLRAKNIDWQGKRIYLTSSSVANFSFFNRIYLNEHWESLPEEEKLIVYKHELEHVQQKHSLDILFLEFIKLVFWFNPAIWVLKRMLQMQHEYLVDTAIRKSHDQAKYAELLLHLAMQPQKKLIATNSISTFYNLKNRFNMMAKTKSLKSIWRYALFLLLFTVSCTLNEENISANYSDDLKFIETVYKSHQSDTQEKNNRTVAIAYFNPDGSFQKAIQHMTYPYTTMEETEMEFWTKPNHDNLSYVMDGFTLGQAEKNLLYGNDWPKVYTSFIEKNGHPRFVNVPDMFPRYNINVDYEGALPGKVSISQNFDSERKNRFRFPGIDEKFEYLEGNVSRYYEDYNIDKYLEIYRPNATEEEKQAFKDAKEQAELNKYFNSKGDTNFSYDGNNLTEVNEGRQSYKFYYDEDRLIKSEFYIEQELYHHREYYYKEDGRRDKTVIYNSMSEPEYTIEYNYGYYEAD